ncbi:MAG: hypothetical protein ACYDBH_02980 [Acidobacteriaceae bacterium]
MKQNQIALALVLAAAGVAPASAGMGTGVSVFGYCKNIPAGPTIAAEASVVQVSTQLATLQTSMSEELARAGRSIAAEEKATSQTIATEFGHQNQVLRNLDVEKGIAQAKARAAVDESPLNQPQNTCDSPTLGAGVQVGGETNRILTKDFSTNAVSHDIGYRRSADATQTILAAPVAAFETPPMFPQDGSMTPQEIGDAATWSNAVTDPNPLPALPAGGAGSPGTERYSAALRINVARLAVPQETLGLIASLHVPTINTGTWADDTWDAMTDSNSGKPPGEVGGRISDDALTRLQVNARYANPAWQISLAQKNSVGVLREIAEVQALRAHIDFERLRLAERRTAIEAQEAAQRANEAARKAAGGTNAQEVSQ